jgi:AcrR family transcriptional regulator
MRHQDNPLHKYLPRRMPRQKRSRLLFDKIIATAKVLFEQEGYAYVTTNRIAEKANISIGSLYQYFKNSESIALAVYEDACAQAALTMKRMVLENLGVPVEESLRMHVERLFEIFEKDHYALLRLIYEIPGFRSAARPLSFSNLISHTTQMGLQQHFTGVDWATIVRKSYVIDRCALAMISRFLDEKPDFFTRKEAIDEITQLIGQYLATLRSHGAAGGGGQRKAPQPPPLHLANLAASNGRSGRP